MKMCTGCKHLTSADHCRATAQPPVLEVNPVTGSTRWVVRGLDGSLFAPTAVKMREAGQPCGPDRALYAPNFFARMISALRPSRKGVDL